MDVDVVEVRLYANYMHSRCGIRRQRGGGGCVAREDSAAETSTRVRPEKAAVARSAGVCVRPILLFSFTCGYGRTPTVCRRGTRCLLEAKSAPRL